MDYEFNEQPICPHCDTPSRNAYPKVDVNDDDTFTATCEHCNGSIAVTVHVEVMYSYSTETN